MATRLYSAKIAGLVGLVIAAAAFGWLTHESPVVSTENAYIKADKFPLSSEVNAPVKAVYVKQNQAIAAGQVLLELDDTALVYAVQEAEAALAQVKNELLAKQSEYLEAKEDLTLAEQDVDFYQRQVARNNKLDSVGVSAATLDEAKQMLTRARSKIRTSTQKLGSLKAELGGLIEGSIDDHARIQMETAALERAKYRLSQAKIVSPVNGYIANQVPHIGQMVFPGMSLVTIIGSEVLWVEANLKETQLSKINVGQTAQVHVDAYPDVSFSAVVESLSPASGSEFALIPAQNASGNWVKVVQRLPVRLKLINPNQHKVQLRAGMSAEVDIETTAASI